MIEATMEMLGRVPEGDEALIRLRSLHRVEQPEDLVGTAVFLASAESDFITGQTIVVDDGEVMH